MPDAARPIAAKTTYLFFHACISYGFSARFCVTTPPALLLAKYGNAELGSAGVSPAVAPGILPAHLLGRDAPATAAGTAALHEAVSPNFARLCKNPHRAHVLARGPERGPSLASVLAAFWRWESVRM